MLGCIFSFVVFVCQYRGIIFELKSILMKSTHGIYLQAEENLVYQIS